MATPRPGLRLTGGRQLVCWEERGGLLFGEGQALGLRFWGGMQRAIIIFYGYNIQQCSRFKHPFSTVMLDQFQLGKFWVFFSW